VVVIVDHAGPSNERRGGIQHDADAITVSGLTMISVERQPLRAMTIETATDIHLMLFLANRHGCDATSILSRKRETFHPESSNPLERCVFEAIIARTQR